MADGFKFRHFIEAQAPVYDTVLAELVAGHKRSHWMWFIFPQLAGLGHSDMARRYALSGVAEAQAYLEHAELGARLFECSALVAAIPDRPIVDIFGPPDDLKFHSCMTLFALAAPGQQIFAECLQKYYAGARDPATLALLPHKDIP
jgi:uncharacterized protein (DUF1810 family)